MFVEERKRLIDWVRGQLIGPPTKGNVQLTGVLPTDRFPCGALYPTSKWGDGIDPVSEEPVEDDSVNSNAPDDQPEPPVVRRYIPPSSYGFSFYLSGDSITLQVLCRACQYTPDDDRDSSGQFIPLKWTRAALTGDDGDVINVAGPPHEASQQSFPVLKGCGRVDVRWRPHGAGWIVTLSLCNTQELADDTNRYARDRAEKTLFEAELRCVVDAGDIGAYPRVDRNLLDDEAREIELQYASRHVYAVGHGCAVDWISAGGRVRELRTNPLPIVEVPQVVASSGTVGDASLSLAHLADAEQFTSVAADLEAFVDGYATWVKQQGVRAQRVGADDAESAKRIVGREKVAAARMRAGIKVMSRDAAVARAFALANRAMLDQMRQHATLQGHIRSASDFRWRPFQLAYLLTVLESAANNESDFRDTVDLIWFPTGGGKTEAYLGLIAFTILLRRLRHPDTGGGTTAIMRYTLRLLTRDQFERASRLICALELLRRKRDDLGGEPITSGLWVGGGTSPNTYQDAAKQVDDATRKSTSPSLVLNACPWCGAEFAPRSYDAGIDHFHFRCVNPDCDFNVHADGVLPCNVVDEALYQRPPTLLVATIDKLARLAWDERTGAFLGGGKHQPPELIIQDELHLIAGALGSVAGIYEAALDTVIKLRGTYPKYAASTATIRMAQQQVQRLYGREVAVFPPPGLDCDDSYFARAVSVADRPGRMYVGYLAPLLNRQSSFAPLAAALLLAPAQFAHDSNAEPLLDAWWTQIVYHGSLRGVGNSAAAFDTDVREYVKLFTETSRFAIDVPEKLIRTIATDAQLTSRQPADENARVFEQLTIHRGDDGCLDAVLATNMISVGLDVARLALMVVNGQPLTTAEYIQASSRVGRADVPGVVFTNYYRDQARSLSHYEDFRTYHEAFYRFVEPTSVTPTTYQARKRALHAALVIVMRHAKLGLLGNDAVNRFDPNNASIRHAMGELAKRLAATSDDDVLRDMQHHLDSLAAEWKAEIDRCKSIERNLQYRAGPDDKGCDRLLYAHGDRIEGVWPTLHSMRNVELTALLKTL